MSASETGTRLRDYVPADAAAVDALAVAGFEQFSDAYSDWPSFKTNIAKMSTLAQAGELIVAESQGGIVGAVAYVGPGRAKSAFFRPEWPVMRMLVVAPEARELGIGRALAEECLARARRDGARVFALHTSELMDVALPMYRRMGFRKHADVPPIHSVRYAVYLKDL